MDFRTSNLSYIIREILNHKRYISATKTSRTTRSDNSCKVGSRKSGERENPVDYGYPVIDLPPGFLRHRVVGLGAMGCDARSSGPRGMEKAKKFRLAEFWDPGIFVATPNSWIQKKLACFGTFHTKKSNLRTRKKQ